MAAALLTVAPARPRARTSRLPPALRPCACPIFFTAPRWRRATIPSFSFAFVQSRAAAYSDEEAVFYFTDGLMKQPTEVIEAVVAHE
jgi:Zn-dependent protease with chaperone function